MIEIAGFRYNFAARVLLVFAFISLVFAFAGLASADKLTIEDSIKIALENNPSVRMAKESMNKADAMVGAANSQGLPHLNLNGNYQRNDKVSVASFNGNEVTLGSIANRTGNVTLTQLVDVFGLVKTVGQAAKYGKSAYSYGNDSQVNDTTLDVKMAYFGILRAQDYLKVQQETVDQLKAHLKDAQVKFDAGTIAKFDVLRADTEVANAQQGLISAQNGVELAKASFNNVLGRPLDTPVDLADPDGPIFINVEQAACVDSAFQTRPEVQQGKMNVSLNHKLTDIARLGSKPKLNLQWVGNRNFDTTVFNPRADSWTAYLGMSMPLYDGGATKSAVDQAASDTKTSEFVLTQITNGVTLDAKQSYLSVGEARARINAANKALDQAKESMRLAEVRYQGGISTQIEVLDAQQALTLAETNQVNALYDYHTALAKLEHAVGGQKQFAKLIGTQNIVSK